LPAAGASVLAIAVVAGAPRAPPRAAERAPDNHPPPEIEFAGRVWEIKSSASPVGPGPNYFSERNAWVDSRGRLHLRIAHEDGKWTCAEVICKESLGYGTYTMKIEETSHLAAGVVLGFFTWDSLAKEQNYREIDVEVSRWGDPTNKNGQFVVQPYTQPENIVRFEIPPGPVVHSIEWSPERVRASSSRVQGSARVPIYDHIFTTGSPSAGREQARINLWLAENRPPTDQPDTEVIISDFEFHR